MDFDDFGIHFGRQKPPASYKKAIQNRTFFLDVFVLKFRCLFGSARRNARAEGEDPRRGKRTELDRILDRHSAIGEFGRELDELAIDPARHAQLKLGGGSLRAFRLALFSWFGGSGVLFCLVCLVGLVGLVCFLFCF